ncbi:MAG: 5-amino-6-(D-ribitylamino)uracil--L-tyrosine 4-hydroxyphenyl transferase CofH [Burkholderiales bacterium]
MDSISDLKLSQPLELLMARAAALRDSVHQNRITYSRKVFIPLTTLCRDVCHYCTFATSPKAGQSAYLSAEQVLAIARAGAAAGCQEALFTLGDKPELRYRQAREELDALGYATTIEYLAAMCELVRKETGLLPHANPGVMNREEIALLRGSCASQGIMLESASARLCQRGGPHFGSPDKHPSVRLETIRLAGELAVPFTTGILIGIGETREERIESLIALRDLHARYGHLQEIIIQNFRAKADTKMARANEPSDDELKWTLAVARIIFGAAMNIQAPPNLTSNFGDLVAAGINDWGGVSPVTPDHVNPEAPWPQIEHLRARSAEAGKTLVERLTIYPTYALDAAKWLDAKLAAAVLAASDASGFARADSWSPGVAGVRVRSEPSLGRVSQHIETILDTVNQNRLLDEAQIVSLFEARGADFHKVCGAADALRVKASGEVVRYVVTRNINYTNICAYRCTFCAFSKGKTHEALRGTPYDLPMEEIARRVTEAWDRGATEVCMQGGIHPDYSGETYLEICKTVKRACPDMHVHAFSPLEVTHGARTLGLSLKAFLLELKAAGLGSLPGTAAEILDDEIRAVICPDKLNTDEWLQVMREAHAVGLRSTSTIMFGHMEGPKHWARHLIRLRDLQIETKGFTEFVPLPFVHMEAPMYLKGRARRGPTSREAILMHAVARLVLHPHISNIQASWVKMGVEGAGACLNAGANDMGGTLMNESISRAAGTEHGQEFPPAAMEDLIRSVGRVPQQRNTLYGAVKAEREATSKQAAPLSEVRLGIRPAESRRNTVKVQERGHV